MGKGSDDVRRAAAEHFGHRELLPGQEEPLTQGWEIKERLEHVVDGVVDSGDCGAEPTTVIDFSGGGAEVVRRGMGDPSRFE